MCDVMIIIITRKSSKTSLFSLFFCFPLSVCLSFFHLCLQVQFGFGFGWSEKSNIYHNVCMNNNTTSFFLSLSLSSAFLLLSAFSASSYNWIIDFMCATLQSSCFNKDNKNRISTSSASCSIKAAAPASPISISLRAPSRWNSLATLTSHLFFRTDFNYYWQLKNAEGNHSEQHWFE